MLTYLIARISQLYNREIQPEIVPCLAQMLWWNDII